MMRWLRSLFAIEPPDPIDQTPTYHGPVYDAAREAYEREKQALMAKHIDTLARINRLGYDVANTTRKDIDDAANRHH